MLYFIALREMTTFFQVSRLTTLALSDMLLPCWLCWWGQHNCSRVDKQRWSHNAYAHAFL